MKPKGRWIERYNSKFESKQIIQTVLCNTWDILKLNVKPKDLWFVKHVLAQYVDQEEGEIFSDDSDIGNENRDLNYYESNPVMTRHNETTNTTKMTKHHTEINYDTTESSNYCDNNYGQNLWKVTNRHKYLPKNCPKYHLQSQTHCRKPFNERLQNLSHLNERLRNSSHLIERLRYSSPLNERLRYSSPLNERLRHSRPLNERNRNSSSSTYKYY